jgi:hypothetical protein
LNEKLAFAEKDKASMVSQDSLVTEEKMHEITKEELEETRTKLIGEQEMNAELTVNIKKQEEEKKKQLSEKIAKRDIIIESLKGSNEKWENSCNDAVAAKEEAEALVIALGEDLGDII